MRRSILLAALLCLAPFARAESPPRVVLAVDGVAELRNLPVLLAERLGYFRDEGLTVTLVDAPAEPSPAELMQDGRADGAVAFYHHTFMSQVDDHNTTRAVVLMGVSPMLDLLVATRLKDKVHGLADLKGLRIFTGGVNSGKTTAANWLVLRGGHTIADYTPLPLAGRDPMEKALVAGEADAIVAHEPDASLYVAHGAAFALADLSSPEGTRAALGTLYPTTALYMPESYIAANKPVVAKLVQACLKALAYIGKTDAKTIAAALPPKMAGKDRDAFVALLDKEKRAFAGDGTMPADGAAEELRVMSLLQPKYKDVVLKDTYTDAFVAPSR